MGQKGSKKFPKFSEEMLDLYLRAEFNVMDTDKDGKLNRRELRNLLTLLGLKKAKRRVEERGENIDLCGNFMTFIDNGETDYLTVKFRNLWHEQKDFDVYKKDDTIHIEDYVDIFKDDPQLRKKTQRLRQLFRIFDKNSDGWASKEEIVAGLEKVQDIEVDEAIREAVEKMEPNDKGKVFYKDFLTIEFQIAMKLAEEEKRRSLFEED